MTSPIEQLESRIHDLINKIGQLHSENQRLGDELAASRLEAQKQAQALEKERQQYRALQAASQGGSELSDRNEYQARQIQLLERERLNLRDQITFLQNTLHDQEKDRQEQLEALRLQNSEQAAAAEAAQSEKQRLLDEAETRFQAAMADFQSRLDSVSGEKEQLSLQLKEVQDRAAAQESSLNAHKSDALALKEQLAAQQTAAETKLLQEQERFRMEYALLAKKHDQTLSDLTGAMNLQKERLVEERQTLHEQIRQLEEQAGHYRRLLQESAAGIRSLLERLPPEADSNQNGAEA